MASILGSNGVLPSELVAVARSDEEWYPESSSSRGSSWTMHRIRRVAKSCE